MDRLTGKYSKENPPPSGRNFGNYPMEKLAPLPDTLRKIAAAHDVKSSAVALKWVIYKGGIPLGGVKNAKQAEENGKAASDECVLTQSEMEELDKLSRWNDEHDVAAWLMWKKIAACNHIRSSRRHF